MAKRQDRSAGEAEPRQGESLDEIDENLEFASSSEALQFILSYIHLIGDIPDEIDWSRRVVRWVALGTGSCKAAASATLSMFDRELIDIHEGQFANEFEIKNDRFSNGLFHLCDTISRENLESQLVDALQAAGTSEDAPIIEMVQNEDYVTDLFDTAHGLGRNAANFPVHIAPNLSDIDSVVNILTPACAVDSVFHLNLGGGSATGFVPIFDGLFRDGPLRPSSYNRDVHQVIMQTEGRAGNQAVETPSGETTTTNAQQHQAVETLNGLLNDGHLQNIMHVHRPLMAHAYTAQARQLSQTEIEDNIGELHTPTNHDQIHATEMSNRAVNANRDNHVMNDMIRRVKCWEHILRVQPDPYELLTYGGDVDRGDIVDRAFEGKMMVPCMRSVASAEELHGKNSDEPHPRTQEQSVRSLVGLLPHSRSAPAPTITGATVAIGVAGESELNQPDIDTFIEVPAAEALDLDVSEVTGMVCNNWTPVTIPGSESWLDGFMLLEVEDTVDTLGRL